MMQLPLVSTYPHLSIALLVGAAFPIFIALAFGHWKIPPSFPKGIPRAGGRKIFGGLRACFRGWPSGRPSLSEGYNEFNRHDRLFIYANGNLRPQAILPVKDFEWVIRQPDSILSPQEVMNDSLSFKHLFPIGRSALDEKIANVVVSQFLTQNLDKIQCDLADELRQNIDREFGKDCHNWQPVHLMEAMQRVVLRTSSRISWGLPLCHDAHVRSLARLINFYAGAMIVCGQLIPWFLQPLLSTCLRVPLYFARKRVWATTTQLVKEWLAQIEQEEREQISEEDSRVPYNLVTSFIRVSRRLYGTEELNKEKLSVVINLFALLPFMTTVPSSSAAILDIVSSPPDLELYQQLRQEATNVLSSEREWVVPTSFKKLRYTDSAIRETLRLAPVTLHASNREVIHPSGITLPTGQHLPRGMWVAASTLDIHTDERFYAEGQSYKPFRYVKEQTNEDGTGMPKQKLTRVAATSKYLPFGSGRHACPGRHFGVHLLKMIIAHIVLNYDMERLEKRPENIICGEHVLVPPSATVRVRRREVN
ncbi:uncharacterized protein CDV56_109530 [Aspergillus thermomutatus]|uniref:Cytochrome P450 n=1 Tax=Aspergillus thermomutatus TaxID=41047 RepID=A0A397HVV7_ASPTH|nr:uncharacterized protein CDV56_109530 [Aspergillus thermomutatus]RHZ67371.1 hypothetical protein CDV56_109530 [Aspergillus thermomutatus]